MAPAFTAFHPKASWNAQQHARSERDRDDVPGDPGAPYSLQAVDERGQSSAGEKETRHVQCRPVRFPQIGHHPQRQKERGDAQRHIDQEDPAP